MLWGMRMLLTAYCICLGWVCVLSRHAFASASQVFTRRHDWRPEKVDRRSDRHTSTKGSYQAPRPIQLYSSSFKCIHRVAYQSNIETLTLSTSYSSPPPHRSSSKNGIQSTKTTSPWPTTRSPMASRSRCTSFLAFPLGSEPFRNNACPVRPAQQEAV